MIELYETPETISGFDLEIWLLEQAYNQAKAQTDQAIMEII